jgi:hypothetical protein
MFEIALTPFELLAMVIISFLASPLTLTMVYQEVWRFVTDNWWWLVPLGGLAVILILGDWMSTPRVTGTRGRTARRRTRTAIRR